MGGVTTPFIIYALPRSRTFWLSRFLSYGGWECSHDELRHVRSLDDVKTWFSLPYVGSVETIAAPWWRLVQEYAPRTVVVRRPVSDVLASLARLGFDPVAGEPVMRRLDAKLRQIEKRVPGVLSVTFDELNTEDGCRRVFEHCLQMPFDRDWWERIGPLNLQANIYAQARYGRAFKPALEKVAKVAKHRSIAAMRAGREEPEGVTIAEESFDQFMADAAPLLDEHCAVVERPDMWRQSMPVFELHARIGALQIITARSNGRLFGYLVTVLGPSFEEAGAVSGATSAFYASPLFPGLGLKLQRTSAEALRAKGVREVFMRSGVLGMGPRTSVLYKRMGAEPFGELYRLPLQDVA